MLNPTSKYFLWAYFQLEYINANLSIPIKKKYGNLKQVEKK